MYESDDKLKIIIEIAVPKFMDTNSLNVDLHPDYVRCDIKGKITQLVIPEEILVE
jgi:protein TilB